MSWVWSLLACGSEETVVVPLAEVGQSQASRITITGAKPRVDLMTSFTEPCGGEDCPVAFVVPLVGPTWTPAQEVPAWGTCLPVMVRPNDCMIAFKQAKTFGGKVVARGPAGDSIWQHALRQAQSTWQLQSASTAPVVELNFIPTPGS